MSEVTADAFRLIGPGGGVMLPTAILLKDGGRTVQVSYEPLATGSHRFEIDAAGVADRAGNPLGTSTITKTFTVAEFSMEWIADRSVGLYLRTLAATGWRVLRQSLRGAVRPTRVE